MTGWKSIIITIIEIGRGVNEDLICVESFQTNRRQPRYLCLKIQAGLDLEKSKAHEYFPRVECGL